MRRGHGSGLFDRVCHEKAGCELFCHKYMGSGVAMVTRLLTYLDANVQNRSTISPPI